MAQIRLKKTNAKIKLDNNLVLAGFFADKLGLGKVEDLQQFADTLEGFDTTDNLSHMYHRITSTLKIKIPQEKLRQYDENICEYVNALSKRRERSISLKYFQYLAVLFSEMYFDRYFSNPITFQNELNDYLVSNFPSLEDDTYSRPDLKKIALWMATGSGKTLMMHINYWQILRYNKGQYKVDFDNVILITQSNELSEQHLKELEDSGISAQIFHNETIIGYFDYGIQDRAIKIINIQKLKLPGEKTEEGLSVDIASFGSKNLLFVDEGHKGYSSDAKKWKKIRKDVARDGFTFEYSATYGQAIDSSSIDFNEYSKSIIFDYSYKYFFKDGYGKDFRILNLDKLADDFTDTVLLANAITFYEQQEVFSNIGNQNKEYNIASPLWIFVGHRVQEDTSDLLRVLQFFNLLIYKEKWAIGTIDKIIKGKSGLLNKDIDVFARRTPETNFKWLREKHYTARQIFDGILEKIFHVPVGAGKGKLRLVSIKNTEGEIALKVGDSPVFGLINIGNRSEFLKLIDKQTEEATVESDIFGSSLFGQIGKDDSSITILIGAKKFIEGWNSYRVSCMGLLNIGKREGSQIIQLFGRGVRLMGKSLSLKRSSHLSGETHPKYIDILETLNIFGIKASYMSIFKDAIIKEELSYHEIWVESRAFDPFPDNLRILRLTKPRDAFKKEIIVRFSGDEKVEGVKVDLLPRLNVLDSRPGDAMYQYDIKYDQPRVIKRELIDALDWDDIYLSLLDFKKENGWSNLLIAKDDLRKAISNGRYQLFCDEDLVSPKQFRDLEKVKDIVVLILRRYIETVYRINRKSWETDNLSLTTVQKDDVIVKREYSIRVKESEKTIIDEIQRMKDSGQIYGRTHDPSSLHNVYFDRHLYQPLLASNDSISITPVGLNEGERAFIEDLKNHFISRPESFKNITVFVLRNLTRGKGIGFFETHGFFPDFILWTIGRNKQNISFIDPKGLVFVGGMNNQKLLLYKYLEGELAAKLNDSRTSLTSFIVSVTPFDVLKAQPQFSSITLEGFENNHVLFQFKTQNKIREANYIERMFSMIHSRL